METDNQDAAVSKLLSTKASRTKDIILGISLISVGLYASISVQMTESTGLITDQLMNHATLPSIWGGLLAALTSLWLVQVINELRHVNKALGMLGQNDHVFSIDRMFPTLSRTLILRMIASIIAIIVYATMFEEAPFFLITGVFLFVMLLAFGRPLHWKTGMIAAIGCAAFHVVFVNFLQLPL